MDDPRDYRIKKTMLNSAYDKHLNEHKYKRKEDYNDDKKSGYVIVYIDISILSATPFDKRADIAWLRTNAMLIITAKRVMQMTGC